MALLQSESVFQIISNYFGPIIPPGLLHAVTVISDQFYETIPDSNWVREQALNDPILAPQKYRKDIFDCDDYVMYLKTRITLLTANKKELSYPLALGFILTEAHAFNFGVTNEGFLFILNTQSVNRELVQPNTVEQCRDFLKISNSNPLKIVYI